MFLIIVLTICFFHKKTKKAFEQYLKLYPKNRTLIVAGGVAANKQIRFTLKKLCQEENFKIYFPDLNFCIDNAAMIAWATLLKYSKINEIGFKANPRLEVAKTYF